MKTLLTLALLAIAPVVSVAQDDATRQKFAAIFREFDTPEEIFDELDCHDSMDSELCPMHDDTIPCAGDKKIEAYCRDLLGEAIVKEDEGKPTGKGLNALEGCKTYVSWDEDKAVCCPSDHCWDEEYDDEDEDEDEFFDDDEFEDEEDFAEEF